MHGPGPFKLEEWTRGALIEYVRNNDYWAKDPSGHFPVWPYVKNLVPPDVIDDSGRRIYDSRRRPEVWFDK